MDLVKVEISQRQLLSISLCEESTIGVTSRRSSIEASPKTTPSSVSSKSCNILSQCFDVIDDNSKPVPTADRELEEYLSMDNNFGPDDDILEFWMKQQHLFPTLATIVMDIYSIPASNTTVERLFSSAGDTITDRRTNLSTEKVNKLLFLKKNLLSLKDDDLQPPTHLQGKRKLDEIVGLSPSPSTSNVNDSFPQEKEVFSSTTSSVTTKKTRIDEKDEVSEDSDGSVEWN